VVQRGDHEAGIGRGRAILDADRPVGDRMNALGTVWSAFVIASGRQKIVIVVAMLVILEAIGSTVLPASSTSPGDALAAHSALPAFFARASVAGPAELVVRAEPKPTATLESTATAAASAPTASASATAAPTPKPTPRPTQKPTSFFLTFTSLTSPISPNNYATAKAKTLAGASCSIDVEYKSGPSTASGLGPTSANSTGIASWTWKVGGRTTPGSWPVTVTCSKGGASRSVSKYLDVV
jgi:hypothetical protein